MRMAKIYSENTSNSEQLKPRKETIRFLLDYSKAFRVIVFGNVKYETFVN